MYTCFVDLGEAIDQSIHGTCGGDGFYSFPSNILMFTVVVKAKTPLQVHVLHTPIPVPCVTDLFVVRKFNPLVSGFLLFQFSSFHVRQWNRWYFQYQCRATRNPIMQQRVPIVQFRLFIATTKIQHLLLHWIIPFRCNAFFDAAYWSIQVDTLCPHFGSLFTWHSHGR